MIKLQNQILFQCEFCGKRLLTKKGAGIHERQYCWHPDSIHQKLIVEDIKNKQSNCKKHEWETSYTYIPGECVKEPDYEMCILCGLRR